MAIEKMASSLEGIECSPIQIISLNEYTLGWSRCKQYENLHKFNNVYFIGKLKFTEKACETLIIHDTLFLKEKIPPLTNGTIIYFSEDQFIVEPLNVTNIFYSPDSVSDMQLLIADAEGYIPSHEGVAILSAVGYFPGNITLFKEIKKIPFLCSYDLINRIEINQQTVKYHEPDDLMMIKRLQKIVPEHPEQYLGLTAGKDSRFIFGILNSRGIIPTAIHIESDEQKLVKDLVESLGCPYIFVPQTASRLSRRVYTLATDAQIYATGSALGAISSYINKDSIFHSGTFAGSILKNVFKTAVKIPGPKSKVYDKCIKMLLGSVRYITADLKSVNTYSELFNYLYKELAFGNNYLRLKTKKETANWFYYLHRGIRWGNAAVMELSYFTNPIFLLADLEALSYGISSTLWDNYAYERIVKLNTRLLPTVNTSYKIDVKLSRNPILKLYQKAKFEYFQRFLTMKKHEKEFKLNSQKEYKTRGFDVIEPKSFQKYYSKDIDQLTHSPASFSLKRAAVTIAFVLNYLEK